MEHSSTVITLLIFRIVHGSLQVFVENDTFPSEALNKEATLDAIAWKIYQHVFARSLRDGYLEQLYTVNESGSLSIVYYLLIHNEMPEVAHGTFVDIIKRQQIKKPEIITYALQRLRWKIEYTNVVYSLLPEEFTLSELQKTYEAILGKPLDKRNFRKKMLSLSIIKKTGKKRKGSAARPAEVYEFIERRPTLVKIFS